jgi:hypothetical protein
VPPLNRTASSTVRITFTGRQYSTILYIPS